MSIPFNELPWDLTSSDGKNNHVSTPELRDSNTSLHHAQSMDANQWTGIKSGRQRASSVWSANSTALRVSIAKALNQKNNLIATSRRPTTTTLLSVNPPGLRNGKILHIYFSDARTGALCV